MFAANVVAVVVAAEVVKARAAAVGWLSKAARALNWYADGAAWLVKHQNEDGSWGRPGFRNQLDADPVIATSFGLLTLGPPRN
jgi:hypothetical protein